MKSVKINDRMFVEVDGYNLTLKQRAGKKDSILGYFANWEGVFDHLIRMYVVDRMPENETITLCELKALYREVKRDISSLIADLKETMQQEAV